MTQWNQLIIDFAIPRTENFTVLSLMVESSEVRKALFPVIGKLGIFNKTEIKKYILHFIGRFRSGHYKVYQMMSCLLRMP